MQQKKEIEIAEKRFVEKSFNLAPNMKEKPVSLFFKGIVYICVFNLFNE